jgi:hypothetical protein
MAETRLNVSGRQHLRAAVDEPRHVGGVVPVINVTLLHRRKGDLVQYGMRTKI